jgi:hypothetical protein
MGLEQKGNGLYYYRKVRRGWLVTSVYMGSEGSPLAAIAADQVALDAWRRGMERAERFREAAGREKWAAADRKFGAWCRAVQALADEWMRHRGHHRRQRHRWSRKRMSTASLPTLPEDWSRQLADLRARARVHGADIL